MEQTASPLRSERQAPCAKKRSPSLAALLLTSAAFGAVGGHAIAQESGERVAQVEEVIVTAQKREERLQDVPVAVTVVGAAQLDRQSITNVADLQSAVPTLSYTAGPSTSYSVRGVGTSTFSRSSESAVSVVVDGVIQGQPVPPTSGLFDVQRVEVLSGPQGMLFGKNASAGLINIVTIAPDLGRREFIGRADLGENGYQSYRAIANLPLGETIALRLSAFSDSEDGPLTNRLTGKAIGDYTNAGARARLRWEVTPDLALNIIADYEKDHGGNMVWTTLNAGAVTPVLKACGVTPALGNTDLCIDGAHSKNIESYGLSIQADWTLGEYTLTSITADRQFSRYNSNDSDALPANLLNTNEAVDYSNQFSQELRITSPIGERLEYVGGLYFYNYNYKASVNQAGQLGIPLLQQLGVQASRTNLVRVHQLSYAAFGQGTFHLTDQWSLIAGARGTYDLMKTSNTFGVDPSLGIFVPGFSNPVGRRPTIDVDTENFSYRVGAQYKPNDDTLFYLTYALGYKGPSTNTGEAAGAPVVRPEIPTNLEFGVKTALFDRRLALDLALYNQDVKDFQAQFVQTSNGFTTFVFGNASHLYVKGAELNLTARPLAGLRLNGGLIYNDATYGNFVVPCRAGAAQTCNVEGRQLAGAPKWKGVISGEYEHSVSDDLDGYAQLAAVYRSRVNSSSSPDPVLQIGGYTVVDGRIGIRQKDGVWGVSIFAKNLFDERFPSLVFADPVLSSNYDQAFSPRAFRTIGISLEGRY